MEEYSYLSFISYRHREKDQQVSLLLRRYLESWHMPEGKRARRRVFRDTDELPTSQDLGTDIERALAESAWLIPVCTEEYPLSRWCMREVELFLEMGRKDRIIPILLEGTPETSIPEAVRDAAFIDLRGAGSRISPGEMRSVIPELLSRMYGIPAERFRQSERRFRLLAAGSAVGAAAAGVLLFSFYALHTANRIAENNIAIENARTAAVAARAEAIEERNEAILKNASFLSESAWAAIAEDDDETAIALALEALPEDLHGDEPVSAEAVGALRMALAMPGRPRDYYELSRTIRPDFAIAGWIANDQTDGGLILTGEGYGVTEHFLTYDTGEIVTARSPVREAALDNGYSMGYPSMIGSPGRWIYYGPEKQMTVTAAYSSPDIRMTLRGEPFYADHLIESGTDYTFLAWLERPAEGQEAHTAIFDMREGEALAELPITGYPVSASFSANGKRLAVVDGEGVLTLFSVPDGEPRAVIEGRWSKVYYPNQSSVFCAIGEDGTACLYDAVNLTPKYAFPCESPIKSLQYCSQKGYFLACCEDGVRIFNWKDGRVLHTFPEKEPPLDAVWEGWDNWLYRMDGNDFIILWPDRVETWSLKTETDRSQSDSVPLHVEGMEMECATAFYSPDSRYIFLQDYGGDVSKWDAETGRLLWVNESGWTIQGNSHDNCILSADGKAIWRAPDYKNGLEKIDAGTGEIIFHTEWLDGNRSVLMPRESPDGRYGITSNGGNGLICFDSNSGQMLWQTEESRRSVFSPSGEEVWSIGFRKKDEDDPDAGYTCRFRRISTETGAILGEQVLFETERNQSADNICIDERGAAAAFHLSDSYGNDAVHHVYLADLLRGEVTGEYAYRGTKGTIIMPPGGGFSLYTISEEDDAVYVRRLFTDGTAGPELDAETEEGRRLITDIKTFGRFAGDETVQNPAPGEFTMGELSIRRISDGAKLFSFNRGIAYGLVTAPDGGSLCIYAYYATPMIIHASDTDTLVARARKRMEGR